MKPANAAVNEMPNKFLPFDEIPGEAMLVCMFIF